ncbi:MAG: hypothetical protein FIA92_17065 [Chloroflexi bacterium]|nr:hypothetical protein [Chloroflexota bacterium]
MNTWEQENEAYLEARDENTAYVGSLELAFNLRLDPSRIAAPLAKRHGYGDALRRAYATRVRSILRPVAIESGLRVVPEPWTGPKAGGPLPSQQAAVELVGLAVRVAEGIMALVGLAGVIRKIIQRVEQATGNKVIVSDGLAVVLAADAIFAQTRSSDLTLAFVTPMNRYLSQLGEFESTFDGWLVGFRARERLFTAHVDAYGGVTVTADSPITWTDSGVS